MLELHKIIRVSHAVVFPIIFLLLCDRDWQGGVLKLMKNDHLLVYLAVWVLFPKFLGRLRSKLLLCRIIAILESHEMIRMLLVFEFPVDLKLLCDRGQ